MRVELLLFLSAAVALAGAAPAYCASPKGAPLVLYTDLVSGPNSGGENDKGAYLSIFGKNFGTSGMGSTVKVFIGGAQVGNYRYLGASKGRPDIEQITVQIGRLGNPHPGTALPIQVVVDGVGSNSDQTFTVNPGRILFVDNVRGRDHWWGAGDINHPFRHVQTPELSGAWGKARPGDIIVMRGTGRPWTDVGFEYYFARFRDKSGSRPSGRRGTGPIVLMGYPTEDVFIHGTLAGGMTAGCVSAVNGQSFPGMGQWIVISSLRIDCEGYDGPINQQIAGNHWRVINNDLAATQATTEGAQAARMGGITGNGYDSIWLGNHIHDIQGSSGEAHGIYVDGDGTYEIAYNLIENIRSGNGFQTYSNGTNGSDHVNNVHFHHNLIREVSKHGINIADGSRSGFVLCDNIVYDIAFAGIRFNTVTLQGALICNNTFYDTNTSGNKLYGVLTNDWNLPAGAVRLENNIFVPTRDRPYLSGEVGFGAFSGTARNNLFSQGSGDTLGKGVIVADPAFADGSAHDFHLRSQSPAIGAGTRTGSAVVARDYNLNARSSATPDLGALAYEAHEVGCSSSNRSSPAPEIRHSCPAVSRRIRPP